MLNAGRRASCNDKIDKVIDVSRAGDIDFAIVWRPMTMVFNRLLLAAALSLASIGHAHAQLRGHGGPVRAVAISSDGKSVVSGSFDTSAIRWSLTRNVALQVMRYHDGAVNAVTWLQDGRVATAGAEGKVALWTPSKQQPDTVFEGHSAPVVSLAASPDGKWLASASWDHTIRLWPLVAGERRVLEGHSQNVNGVAFTPDSRALVSAGYDETLRIWPIDGASAPIVCNLPTPLNSVVVEPDGEIVTAGADGKIYFISAQGDIIASVSASPAPVIALAASSDGHLIAAAGIRGSVGVIDRREHKLLRTLVGPGLPVWSVAFFPDNKRLVTGGTDGVIRQWDAMTGEPIDSAVVDAPNDPLAAYANDPGARVFRACVACHALQPDEDNKAGPNLAGVMGRKIATLPNYRYSEALKHMNIVWSKKTIAKMFEVGPMVYTPGTKMPEQKISSEEDRRALVDFLARATATK
jgi:cytochrome c